MTIGLHTHTIEKLRAVVNQIDSLLLSDFPHNSAKDALVLFKEFFDDQIARVGRASAERNLLISACTTANSRISSYLPLLGFLLRSTNVRNNFECYDSLLQLAQRLIGPDARIVISSEWDMSPLTYALSVPVLPGYVLLGMPATESTNALILPLTGHELGHSIWTAEGLESDWAPKVQKAIHDYIIQEQAALNEAFPVFAQSKVVINHAELSANMFLTLIADDVSRLTLGQMEETYCDAIGLKIFGESFVYAFHYLLAPGFGGDRSLYYPSLRSRAQYMTDYSGLDFDILGFSSFPSEFHEKQPRLSPDQKFISRAADEIAKSLAKELYSDASNKVLQAASDLVAEPGAAEDILALFKRGIPSRRPRSLPDILNAGWQFVRAEAETHDTQERELFEWTSELVLKSIEVLEFRRRLDA